MPGNGTSGDLGQSSWRCLWCGSLNSSADRSCMTCGAPAAGRGDKVVTLDAEELLERFGPGSERLISGRYRLTQAIGGGATGSVFKAIDTNLDRLVAIKVLSSSSKDGMDDRTRLLRLQTEGQVLGRLKHPGLVTVYDMGSEEGVLYVVMEFVRGCNLKSLLRKKHSLPVEDSVFIMIQVADALHYVNKHGIVHRDLKPSNIMLLEGNRAKITDFGLAKVAFGQIPTEAGLAIGTPYYMSPEQLRAQNVDHRADIFSAGIILYEMVTGQKPFYGESLGEIVQAILGGEFIRPRELKPSLPAEIESVILKALAAERGKRYFSMKELADDLRDWQSKRAFSSPELAKLTLREGREEGLAEVPGKRRSRKEIAAGLSVFLVFVLAAGAILHFTSPEYALRKEVEAILEDYAMQRFEHVYRRLSDDFKARHSLREFLDLPYLGFVRPSHPGAMVATVEEVIFLRQEITANVIVTIRYSEGIGKERYTMRWVKEGGRWRYLNPDYQIYLKQFPRSDR